MEIFIEFLKLTLPSGFMLYLSYLMVRAFIGKEQKQLHAKVMEEGVKITLPLRLQAYERLCLFLERITIANLVSRITQPKLSGKNMQHLLLHEIREEFNHNLSQQIYISHTAWEQIKVAVEEIILLINRSADELPETGTHTELIKKIFTHMQVQKYDTTANALKILKTEAEHLL